MTVNTFDPHTNPGPETANIGISPKAATHIKAQMEKSGRRYLRLAIKESGCNGYRYVLDHLDEPDTQDLSIAVNEDLQVHVSRKDMALVNGTRIDFVTEGLNSALQFTNPNADSYCGCGESFSVATSGK